MGGSTQQTTQSNEPWSAAQPSLKSSISEADRLYNSQVGKGAIPWDAQTQTGMGQISNLAAANSNGKGLSGQYQGVIDNGGYNAAQKSALDNTMATANSKFDINSNPAFMDVLRQSTDAAANSVNQNASAAGRYGSGTNQQLLGSTVGDLTSRMVGNEYTNWQARRDAANQQAFQMGQTGLGNLGSAYDGAQTPAKTYMMLGGMNEDLANRNRQNDWTLLGQRQNVVNGASQGYGMQTNTSPGQNPFLTGLGYASAGAGLLGSFA